MTPQALRDLVEKLETLQLQRGLNDELGHEFIYRRFGFNTCKTLFLGLLRNAEREAPAVALVADSDCVVVLRALEYYVDTSESRPARYNEHIDAAEKLFKQLLAEREAPAVAMQVDCPLCGEQVQQVASATLSLALWQHVQWACRKT